MARQVGGERCSTPHARTVTRAVHKSSPDTRLFAAPGRADVAAPSPLSGDLDQTDDVPFGIGARRSVRLCAELPVLTGQRAMADARHLVALLETGDEIDPVIGKRVFRTAAARTYPASRSSWPGPRPPACYEWC